LAGHRGNGFGTRARAIEINETREHVDWTWGSTLRLRQLAAPAALRGNVLDPWLRFSVKDG
jgi:hypothetical protein